MIDTTTCPSCGRPAEIRDRRTFWSSDGWVEQVAVVCVAYPPHNFFMTVAMLERYLRSLRGVG